MTYYRGDKVRCTSTWTTYVVDRGEDYTVDDAAPGARTILVNGQWVPVTYFEKIEPAINWAEIAGSMTARAVNAEQRAEKAEASLRESDAALQAARETLARVEDLAAELIRAGGTVNGQFIRARLRNAP